MVEIPPFESVAFTETVYVPATVGVQVMVSVAPNTHPKLGSDWVHVNVYPPLPPLALVENVTDWPTSIPAEAIEGLGVVTAGIVSTTKLAEVSVAEDTPFESVANTETV
ncbi:MAG: hypothetical protein ABSA63_01855 [Thermoplasmata archaeon]